MANDIRKGEREVEEIQVITQAGQTNKWLKKITQH